MVLSDISVKRPVFAAVISLLLIAFGVLSFVTLPLREYPDIETPIVSVETRYPGASADIIESRITQPIEDEIAGIEGIRSVESNSRNGRSSIDIEFKLERDIDIAANDVRDKVSRVIRRLPDEADPPIVSKAQGDSGVMLWMNLTSDSMNGMELTDYADRYLSDSLSAVDGVARIMIGGSRRYAMRIWLDRVKMAARDITTDDIENALRTENIELPAGRIESTERELTVRVARNYQTAQDFSDLVVKRGEDGYLVRLRDIADVEIGPEDDRNEFRGNSIPMVGLGVIKQSKANTLEVSRGIRARVTELRKNLPEGMSIIYNRDDSVFIEAAITEVYRTFAIAMVLVIIVIYLFLGSVRAMLIPAVTVPISITASFIVLSAFGFSVNLLTLLAMVLSIGLVVDDAIVVLENIYRRIESGEKPLLAAYNGARQVGMAVVATTLVLMAVFVPVVFLEGNIGRVFKELAVAMGSAVLFSSIVALSLSPMMCSKLLKKTENKRALSRWVDRFFDRMSGNYTQTLASSLRHPALIGLGMIGMMFIVVLLVKAVPSEFAPSEDRGGFLVVATAPEGASFEYTQRQMRKVEDILMSLEKAGEADRVLIRVPGFGAAEQVNTGIGIVNTGDWSGRGRSTQQIVNETRAKLSEIPGIQAFPVMFPGLGGRGGSSRPVEFVIGGNTYDELAYWQDIIVEKAEAFPGLTGVEGDFKETQPQLMVHINRDRAADLGVSIEAIGRTLETMLNSRQVTTYLDRGQEYDVILQGRDEDRVQPDDMTNIYVRSQTSGQLIPLSALVEFRDQAGPATLSRFNRQRALTISASVAPGYTLGEGLDFLEKTVQESLPEEARTDYKGESREFKEASGALYFTFGLALLVVFLVLAAQFESFIHPLVIMATVPLALVGALIGLLLTDGTLNVYSQVGIIMLVGIATKNGILIVEFANQLRDEGRNVNDAIVEACRIRLRPILMTVISTVIGALPLIFAFGAGAESRATIGVVIFAGVSFSTLFTLFVVPTFYNLLAPYTSSPEAVAAELKAQAKSPAE